MLLTYLIFVKIILDRSHDTIYLIRIVPKLVICTKLNNFEYRKFNRNNCIIFLLLSLFSSWWGRWRTQDWIDRRSTVIMS